MGGEWICAPQYVWHWYDRWRYASFQVALNFLHHITSLSIYLYIYVVIDYVFDGPISSEAADPLQGHR